MKRIMSLLLAAVLLCSAFTAAVVPMASAEDASTVVEETGKTREICLVYDDSGSMDYSSRWLYAKYALKIFGALLTENDTLSVYPMNQINNGGDPLTLKGSASTAEIVSAIDDNVYTYPGGEGPTPYATVQRAYADLQSSSADIKWLVVLTDGQFTDVTSASGVAELFTNKPDDISVLFYGLALNDAPKAAMDGYKTAIEKILSGEQGVGSALTSDEDVIVTYTLQNAAEKIVEDMQEIAKKVFNRNSIEAKKLRTEGTKVPMSEVVVFAQGAEVPITGIRAVDGSAEYKVTDSVTVESNDYAYKDIENDPCIKNTEDIYPPHDGKPEDDKVCTWDNPDKIKMYGTLASVTGSYTSNTKYEVVYEGDISEDNIVIFFKPNVKLRARLIDAEGAEYLLDEVDGQQLDSGDYNVIFEIIAADTGEVIDDPNITEGLSFSGKIGGKDLPTPDDSGKFLITLEPGDATFDITAIYNDGQYKTPFDVTVKINNKKALTYELAEAPELMLDKEGLHGKEQPIKVKALSDGVLLTKEQWDTLDVPKYSVKGGGLLLDLGVEVTKAEEPGYYYITLSEAKDGPLDTERGDITIHLSYDNEHNGVKWKGSGDIDFTIQNGLSIWDIIISWLKNWWGLLLIIALLVLAAILVALYCNSPALPNGYEVEADKVVVTNRLATKQKIQDEIENIKSNVSCSYSALCTKLAIGAKRGNKKHLFFPMKEATLTVMLPPAADGTTSPSVTLNIKASGTRVKRKTTVKVVSASVTDDVDKAHLNITTDIKKYVNEYEGQLESVRLTYDAASRKGTYEYDVTVNIYALDYKSKKI